MNSFKNLAVILSVIALSACTTSRKIGPDKEEFAQKIDEPGYQAQIYGCYHKLVDRQPAAEGFTTIDYHFYSKHRKDVKITGISEKLQDLDFVKCLENTTKQVDVSELYDRVDQDYDYSITVRNKYYFRKSAQF